MAHSPAASTHNHYGRLAKLADASFARHLSAFDGAFPAHMMGVMPAYPIVTGVTVGGARA